jgi:hypothetical protein
MTSPLALALMSPNAPGITQPSGFSPSSLQPTNVIGAYQNSQNAAEQNYQAQLQQNNAMWGGLAGLGSSAVLAGANYLKPAAAAAVPVGGAAAANTAAAGSAFGSAPVAYPGIGSISDLLGGGGAAATDAYAAGAPIAADVAASAAPAVADAGASFSIADILPLLAGLFA